MQTTAGPTLVGTAHHVVNEGMKRDTKGQGTEKLCILRNSIVSFKNKKKKNKTIISYCKFWHLPPSCCTL